ncbi:MAG: hypothetical protein BYD32DRAFT_439710 [Podila humilis]|nr:MAG: hypothetical protein BYD32DRAFT_439710 [Podila humilis]
MINDLSTTIQLRQHRYDLCGLPVYSAPPGRSALSYLSVPSHDADVLQLSHRVHSPHFVDIQSTVKGLPQKTPPTVFPFSATPLDTLFLSISIAIFFFWKVMDLYLGLVPRELGSIWKHMFRTSETIATYMAGKFVKALEEFGRTEIWGARCKTTVEWEKSAPVWY